MVRCLNKTRQIKRQTDFHSRITIVIEKKIVKEGVPTKDQVQKKILAERQNTQDGVVDTKR